MALCTSSLYLCFTNGIFCASWRNNLGSTGCLVVEWMGLSCIVSQHMEALCKFLKGFPSYYCHLLESCSINNYESGTRRWAVPLTGVKQLTFAQPLIGLNGPAWNAGILSATAFLLYVLYILEFFVTLYMGKFCQKWNIKKNHWTRWSLRSPPLWICTTP